MSTSSGAAVERSISRVLRGKGIDERIECTSTLVACYNDEEDTKTREALRKWLEAYFVEFSRIRSGSIPRKTVAEFVVLAEIKVRESADAELVRRVYTTIRQIVMRGKEDCSVYFVLALERILSNIDKDILQGDARTLVALADRLIEMTDPQKMPLTRDTFEYCASCLNAFERVLMVLHDLEKDCSDNHIVKYFEDKTKRHLDMIIDCQCYYPFAYQALLIKEHLNALVKRDIKSNLINAGRRAFYAVCGGLYIFQGVRELAVMKLDFNVMVSGLEKIQQAFKDIGWDSMTEIHEIVLAASETVESQEFGIFLQCYKKYQNVSWHEGLRWNKQRMIRYTIVTHLSLFCTEKHSASIQEPGLDFLLNLVTEEEGKQWRNDTYIFEALIEALIAIGNHNHKYQPKIISAFDRIRSSQSAQHTKIINGLLKGKTLYQVITSRSTSQEDAISRSLFDYTRQKLGLQLTAPIYNQNQQTLKAYYKDDSFAKVSLLADKIDGQHIGGFDFNLVEYERFVVIQDAANQPSHGGYNQRENNMHRSMVVRKPISMQDLFKKRQKTSHGFRDDVKSVLVIGDPGTGKTCLSKRLSYDWAINAWGLEFTHVYHLPIRRLSDKSFGNDVDLSFIIRRVLYKSSGTHNSYKALCEEINDNLSEATTLLIVDGYDEAGELAKDLVLSALTRRCRLLILSRPHSIQDIRSKVDIEVECLELSNPQLERFVRKQLEDVDATALLKFLSGNLSIKDVCRVVVTAQIVTRLWRNVHSRRQLTNSTCANLKHLYSMIANYIWRRFAERSQGNFNRDLTYHRLECIAFESLKKGFVEIPEELVMEHAPEIEEVFRDSGFLLFVEEGIVFQFAHLTFHEYFAGCHLAKLLSSTDGKEKKRAERFIAQHKYVETNRVMLSFMTQCFCMKGDAEENLDAFIALMRVLDKDQVSTIGFPHLLLKMRLLDAFLPCGIDDQRVVYHNKVVAKIVDDATKALKQWFDMESGYNIDRIFHHGNESVWNSIVDDLSRMPNLFYHFSKLLRCVLLCKNGILFMDDEDRCDIGKIGRLNPNKALECIKSMIDDATTVEKIHWLKLCAFIGPSCARPLLNHLKILCTDHDPTIRGNVAGTLLIFLDLFPNDKEVRQMITDLSEDPNDGVRKDLTLFIGAIKFAPESNAQKFVWDLLVDACNDANARVRSQALRSCIRQCPTCVESLNKLEELVLELANSAVQGDRSYAASLITELVHKVPEESVRLIDLMKALCRDLQENVRREAVEGLLNIVKNASLRAEDLFNVAFDTFNEGYEDVQYELLPTLFCVAKKANRKIDEVIKLIDKSKDLEPKVQEKVDSCIRADSLLSKLTVEEIHNAFYDQGKKVQQELVTQFDLKEIDITEALDAIAKMAVKCLEYDEYFRPSLSLLEKLSKTFLFPDVILENLANQGIDYIVRQQPFSHLLEYYLSTKDQAMIQYIADKLLLSPVIFEKRAETEVAISFREKGAIVVQIAPIEVVEDLLSLCKDFLKEEYGLDFFPN